MPTRRGKQSRSQRPKRSTAKKFLKAVLPGTKHPSIARLPSAGMTKNGALIIPAQFTRATRKLLTRHAEELQRVITEGRQIAPQGYGSLLRDLEMLQAAAKKIVTDLAILAGEG
jgi:hypothetical protein